MRRIFYSKEGSRTIGAFRDNADSKVRKKFRFLLGLMRDDKMVLCEPYVKHFGIEKYKRLYELRMKAGGAMVRIIYCERDNGDIIFLYAFYKKDKRDTQKALDYALMLLDMVDENELSEVNYDRCGNGFR